MADIREWAKGLATFALVTLAYYFLWQNVFSNIIEMMTQDLLNIGSEANTSMAIMKAIAWATFVILYLATGGVYLIYTIMVGAKGKITTKPVELLKAIGVWSVAMPIMVLIHGIVYIMTNTLTDSGMLDAGGQNIATNFSWILAILSIIVLIGIPFTYVLKGYGVDLFGTNKEEQ